MAFQKSVKIIEGVSLEKQMDKVVAKGPKGESEKIFENPHVSFEIKNGEFIVKSPESKKEMAIARTWLAHIRNMMKGVVEGYECRMKIVFMHFPISAKAENGKVEIKNFFGGRGPIYANIVGKVQVDIQKEEIVVRGVDKEEVGQTAANIEKSCVVKRKDRRIFSDGIYITKKP